MSLSRELIPTHEYLSVLSTLVPVDSWNISPDASDDDDEWIQDTTTTFAFLVQHSTNSVLPAEF
jgi:hypothetical protein